MSLQSQISILANLSNNKNNYVQKQSLQILKTNKLCICMVDFRESSYRSCVSFKIFHFFKVKIHHSNSDPRNARSDAASIKINKYYNHFLYFILFFSIHIERQFYHDTLSDGQLKRQTKILE